MPMQPRSATAIWKGDGATGAGTISTLSGALQALPYNFKARFQSEDGKAGSNPEELIAAAHAGCFTMALSFGLSKAGHPPTQLDTTAEVSLSQNDAGFSISGINLITKAQVPGIDAAKFQEIASGAKAGCPISRALSAVPITLEASLV
jgi:osmotically inducible protein OsmC